MGIAGVLLSILLWAAQHAPLMTVAQTKAVGELLTISVHAPAPLNSAIPEQSTLEFFLNTDPRPGRADNLRRLVFPGTSAPTDLATGDVLSVTLAPAPKRSLRALAAADGYTAEVESYTVLSRNPGKTFPFGGQTVDFTSLTILTNICGKKSVENVAAYKALWVSPPSTSARSMQAFFRECSYGRLRANASSNIVVDLTRMPSPCAGTWNRQAWSASRCGTAEIFGWYTWALDYVAKNMPHINATAYDRKVIVLPATPACPWSGLASVGCGGLCIAWINGGDAVAKGAVGTLAHEIGHTLALQHSSTPGGNEYGDASCTMGRGRGGVCYNAAQSWRLGWSLPIKTLSTAASLPLGIWKGFQINTFARSRYNHVQIRPGAWLPPSFDNRQIGVFVSVRQAVNRDVTLADAFTGGLSVHVYNGTTVATGYSNARPQLIGVVFESTTTGKNNDRLSLPSLRLVIRLKWISRTHAGVMVCRGCAPITVATP